MNAAIDEDFSQMHEPRICFPDVTLKVSMAYFSEFWRASAARRRTESLKY